MNKAVKGFFRWLWAQRGNVRINLVDRTVTFQSPIEVTGAEDDPCLFCGVRRKLHAYSLLRHHFVEEKTK